jgi:hypothetical protein
MVDIAHLLRPGHLQQLANILEDPEASSNDRFVALELLKNANVAAGKILPGCQDTGTAIVQGKRGQYVWTDGNDEEALSRGVFDTYTGTHLRYSQVAPLDMFTEANTKNNLPAQVEIYAQPGKCACRRPANANSQLPAAARTAAAEGGAAARGTAARGVLAARCGTGFARVTRHYARASAAHTTSISWPRAAARRTRPSSSSRRRHCSTTPS